VTPVMFAEYLDSLIDDEVVDPQQQVQLPEPLA